MDLSDNLCPILFPPLSQISSLSSLNLSCNNIGAGWNSHAVCATALAQLLVSLPSLQELSLHSCKFDSGDVFLISQSFPHLPFLCCLNLSNLMLEDSVVEPLLGAFLQMRDLRFLHIRPSCFQFSEHSQSHLRTSLRSRFPLLHLILTAHES